MVTLHHFGAEGPKMKSEHRTVDTLDGISREFVISDENGTPIIIMDIGMRFSEACPDSDLENAQFWLNDLCNRIPRILQNGVQEGCSDGMHE